MAAPIVGENSMGIRLAWRSFEVINLKHLSVGRTPSHGFILRGRRR
jgi:hypothetical protein